MKRILSNPSFLHCFYLFAIAVISYTLWNVFPAKQECRSAKSIEKSLADANEIMASVNEWLRSEIDENCKAYPSSYMLRLRDATLKSDSITRVIFEAVKVEKDKISLAILDGNTFFYNEYSSIPTRNTLSEENVKQLKNHFQAYFDFKNNNQLFDNSWEQECKPQLDKLLDNVAWEDLNKLSVAGALAQLESIKTAASAMNNLFLIKVSKMTSVCMKFDKFSLVIAANKGAVKIGEEFQADLAVCEYASNPRDITISCDNQVLAMKEGVASFQKRFTKVGKQTITAKASLRNPLTGQEETALREYSIEVLPK